MTDYSVPPWILTARGEQFFYDEGAGVSSIKVEDIAFALSNLCRFTGHTLRWYSVGEHSLRVCELVMQTMKDSGVDEKESRRCALWGLLHDASEAYTGDVNAPLKRWLLQRTDVFQKLEADIMRRVGAALGLEGEEPEIVKQADLTLCVTEGRDVMPPMQYAWLSLPHAPLPQRITPMPSGLVHRLFVDLYYRLKDGTPARRIITRE